MIQLGRSDIEWISPWTLSLLLLLWSTYYQSNLSSGCGEIRIVKWNTLYFDGKYERFLCAFTEKKDCILNTAVSKMNLASIMMLLVEKYFYMDVLASVLRQVDWLGLGVQHARSLIHCVAGLGKLEVAVWGGEGDDSLLLCQLVHLSRISWLGMLTPANSPTNESNSKKE